MGTFADEPRHRLIGDSNPPNTPSMLINFNEEEASYRRCNDPDAVFGAWQQQTHHSVTTWGKQDYGMCGDEPDEVHLK